jgi:hypothetical protein
MSDTFRYVRVKFAETAKWYTYRSDFMVKEGDEVRVPTIYGDSVAVVKGTSADEDFGFPTAKWLHGFCNPHRTKSRWPKYFRVRNNVGQVLYANQTKVCRPGEEPSSKHAAAPHVVNVHVNCRSALADAPRTGYETNPCAEIEMGTRTGRWASGGPAPVFMSSRQNGKSDARLADLVSQMMAPNPLLMALSYGMSEEKALKQAVKQAKKGVKRAAKELAAAEDALAKAKAEKRLAKLEEQLEAAREEQEFREEYKDAAEKSGVDLDEVLELRKTLEG